MEWRGPFLWPGVEVSDGCTRLEDSPVARASGLYLWTVPYQGVYLIYAAGQTTRAFVKRLNEHSNAHRNGFFTIFNMDDLERGVRTEIWHGSFGGQLSPERKAEFEERRDEIREAAQDQVARFRVFVGPVATNRRLLARLEAGIMDSLYAAPAPFSSVPDKGMSLSRRWRSEPPIQVHNVNIEMLHVLPSTLEI